MSYDNPVEVDIYAQPVFQQDKRLHVRFYQRAVKNNYKSAEAGRPVFDDKDYVQIHVPGDRNTMIDQEATTHYQMRWPEAWKRYKDGKESIVDGTPLDSWPALTPAQTAELKALHVYTVDQLAGMSDQQAQKVMGNFSIRQKAQDFLARSVGIAEDNKREAELALRDDQIAELKRMVQELQAAQGANKLAAVTVPAAPVKK